MKRGSGDPVVQSLLEALEGQPSASSLIWGRGLSAVTRALAQLGQVHTLLQDARDATSGVGETSFGVMAPRGAFDRIVTRLPRSKEALRWRLAAAAAALEVGGQLWLVGHQREGIKSAVKHLEAAVGPTVNVHTKRRCRVLVARRDATPREAPSLDGVAREVAFEAAGQSLTAVSLPGVFSHGRLDEGTRRMLDWLAVHPPTGRVLDLGAGAGILGVACAAHPAVSQTTLTEVAWVGAEACRRTVAGNDATALAPITVQHADVAQAAQGPFDLVVTNPPFHDGREEDRQLIGHFAAAAAARLAPQGRLVAVCNRHLPYRDALEAHFGRVVIAWEDTRFRIWECSAPSL